MADFAAEFEQSKTLTGGASSLASEFESLKRTSGLGSGEPQRQGFLGKAESFAVGERTLFEPKTKLGKVAAFVPNFLASMFRGPLNKTMEIAEAAAVPSLIDQQKKLQETRNQFAELDTKFAAKIRSLAQQNTPQSRLLLDRLREFYVNRTNSELPEPLIPKSLNKSGLQSFGELAELEAFITIMGSPGFQAIRPFNQATEAIVTKGRGIAAPLMKGGFDLGTETAGQLLKNATIAGLGYGAENALYGAIAEVAAPRELDEKPTIGQIAKTSALSGLIGGGIGLGLGAFLPRFLRGRAAAAELARDMLDVTSARASQAVVDVPGFRRETLVNLKRTKPRELKPEVFLPEAREDFRNVLVGDVVRTKEGQLGIVSGIEDRFVTTPQRVEVAEINRKLSNIREQLPRAVTAQADLLLERERALQKRLEDILLETQIAGEGLGELTAGERVRAITLRVKRGKPGALKLVDLIVPEESILDGGMVRARERLVPVRRTPTRERVASELTDAQLRRSLPVLKFDNEEVPIRPDTGPEITSKELREEMARRGHQVVIPEGERTGRIKRATPLNFFQKEETTFRQSQIDFSVAQRQEALADSEQINIFNNLRALAKTVFSEEGLTLPETFRENLKFAMQTILPKNRQKLRDLSRKLFDAAQGDIPMSDLTASQARLVEAWKEVARDLLDRVNKTLISIGKEPIRGIDKYITNILAPQAMAALKLSTALPSGMLESLVGKKAAGLFRRMTPEQVSDMLLQKRYGGLPIERDFFKSINTAVQSHTRFIHLQPALSELNKVVNHFRSVYGEKFPLNASIMENTLNKLAGKDPSVGFLRQIDQTLLEFLTAEKWAGFPNIMKGFFGEFMDTEALGKVFVPKNKVIKAVEALGPGRGILSPREFRKWFFVNQLAFSIPYMVTNMTQFWTLAVPKLRGPMATRYKNAVGGWLKAWKDWFSPEMRKAWKESGLLQEIGKFEAHEMGEAEALLGGVTMKGGVLNRIFNTTTEFSEFINRVGTWHATYDNILSTTKFKDGKNFNAYWDKLNELTDGELYKQARKLSKDIADETNFKFGITHRAPISDNPIGALWDQFNSFTRNWFSVVKGMGRKMKHDKEFMNAFEQFRNGDGAGPLIDWFKSEKTQQGERGEAVRFIMNGLAFWGVMGGLGMSFGKSALDIFAGGGTRLAEGMVDIWDGIAHADEERMDRGLKSVLLPPSVPPVLDAAKDVYQWSVGNEKFSAKKALLSTYSPFRKPLGESLPALKAIWSGVPTPVQDQRTGKIKYIIDPKDAVNKLVFGFRGKADSERNKELDEIARLRAKDTQKGRERSRIANEIIDEMESRDRSGRMKYWNELLLEDKLDQNLVDSILSNMYERKIMRSGSIERSLPTLSAESRVEFIRNKIDGLDQSEKRALILDYVARDIISDDVAAKALE